MSTHLKESLNTDPKDIMPSVMDAPLAGIIWQGELNYYAAPRVLWYLDYQKVLQNSRSSSMQKASHELLAHRSNILIVDNKNKDVYLKGLEPYRRTCQELRDAMCMCLHDYELDDFVVQLLINFDENHLISHCTEPFFFEQYVPDDWTSEYRAFRSHDIPHNYRFWYTEDNRNLFDELFKETI